MDQRPGPDGQLIWATGVEKSFDGLFHLHVSHSLRSVTWPTSILARPLARCATVRLILTFVLRFPPFIKAARASLGETEELCVCSRRQRRRRRRRRPKPYPGLRKWLQLGGPVPGTSRRQADVWGYRHTSELVLLPVRARTILTVEVYRACVRPVDVY